MDDNIPRTQIDRGGPALAMAQSLLRDRVQVRERNGIWEVKVDGRFRGDYHQKEHADAAAAILRLSL